MLKAPVCNDLKRGSGELCGSTPPPLASSSARELLSALSKLKQTSLQCNQTKLDAEEAMNMAQQEVDRLVSMHADPDQIVLAVRELKRRVSNHEYSEMLAQDAKTELGQFALGNSLGSVCSSVVEEACWDIPGGGMGKDLELQIAQLERECGAIKQKIEEQASGSPHKRKLFAKSYKLYTHLAKLEVDKWKINQPATPAPIGPVCDVALGSTSWSAPGDFILTRKRSASLTAFPKRVVSPVREEESDVNESIPEWLSRCPSFVFEGMGQESWRSTV
ncbi:hypothetical protein BASA81_003305 [Batrachochytrium salamandrivorans]|nr:hypothetical protein BASA81_003305 [Batrachochytrium salamandrivorans]